MVSQGQKLLSLLIFAVFPGTILGIQLRYIIIQDSNIWHKSFNLILVISGLKCWQSSVDVNSVAGAAGSSDATINDLIKSTLTDCNSTTIACTIAGSAGKPKT